MGCREACAGPRIENMLRVREEPPRHDRVDDMFDGCFPGIEDARQIEMLIRLDNQIEMSGRSTDERVPFRDVVWNQS